MYRLENKPIPLLVIILILGIAFYLRLGAITGTVVDNPIRADATDYYFYA